MLHPLFSEILAATFPGVGEAKTTPDAPPLADYERQPVPLAHDGRGRCADPACRYRGDAHLGPCPAPRDERKGD